jgi:peroxiredoxin (alkyl hydroperoxide reductase subunit C)
MSELKDGCVKPAAGPILPDGNEAATRSISQEDQEVKSMLVQVGKEAIDFEASAFVPGKGFQPVKLSSYKGKWIVLCFYPGDFTYV